MCPSMTNEDKRSLAAAAGGIGVPDVDEDAIAIAFAKSVSLMKEPARELLLVQAPVLHRFGAVRLVRDDRKKCVHWQALFSDGDLSIVPTGTEALEDPKNPALWGRAMGLARKRCLADGDDWLLLDEAHCLEKFTSWLVTFDAYADWKQFLDTSASAARALTFRSDNRFQKALVQETVRLMRWLL